LGIPLEHYALLKSITGDTADSIKGIPNIGPKSAAALIKTHGADLITNDLLLRWYSPETSGLERISELLKAYRQTEGLTQKSCVETFGSIWRDLERGTERRLHYTEYQPLAEAVPEIRTYFTYQAHAETVARNLRLITLPFQLV
jgi:5'-3' exonuclease